MFNKVDEVNVQELLLYLVLGIVVCAIAVFVIKVTADYIWQTGKIVYKRYMAIILLAFIPVFFYREVVSFFKINIPFITFQIIGLLILLLILVILILKAGIIRGICMFIIQLVGAILCVSVMYAGMAFAVIGFALIAGIGGIIEGKYCPIIAIDDGEIVYVRSREDYFYDQYGQFYMRTENYIYRMDDNKMFMFM